MAKRKAYYVKDENGKWIQVSELPEFNSPEQLSFAFDVDQETAERLKDGEEMESTVSIEPTEAIKQLFDVDSDDIYEALLDEIDKLRNCWLNAMYYIDHSRTLTDIMHSDTVTKREVEIHYKNIQVLLNDYLNVCSHEYNSERNPIAQSIAKNKLN